MEFAAPGRILGNIGAPLRTLDDDAEDEDYGNGELESPTDVDSGKDETVLAIRNIDVEGSQDTGGGDRIPESFSRGTADESKKEVCNSLV